MNDIKISENFNLKEFACKCGCNQVMLHSELLKRLQQIRTMTGLPVRINSGYRCPIHNKLVGGAVEVNTCPAKRQILLLLVCRSASRGKFASSISRMAA